MTKSSEEKSRLLLICLSLAIVTLGVFWQVGAHEFINYDDTQYVTENPQVQVGLTLPGIVWSFTSLRSANWHPLTWLSHMLDCQLFGLSPGWHHVMNLCLHVVNTVLLFLVLHRMTKALWRSAFVAALFALHPLHVESVAWVAERKDVLSTLFWMLALGAYVRYAERPGIRRYLLIVLFFVMGLLSKPMLVTLPFVLLLMDWWPLGRFQPPVAPALPTTPKNSGRRKVRATHEHAKGTPQTGKVGVLPPSSIMRSLIWEKMPLFVFSAISSVVTVYAQKKGGTVYSLGYLPLDVRLGNVLVAYVHYIGKMIWPLNLAVFYPLHASTGQHVFVAALLLVAISVPVLRGAKRFPYLAMGWFWFLGALVPVIGLVQVGQQAIADRYTYVPFIGLFIMIAWGVCELVTPWRLPKAVLATAAGLCLLALTMATFAQLQYWQNSITLFSHALKVTQDNAIAHINLGVALRGAGKTNEAEYHYEEALRITPDDEQAHYNLGNLLLANGKRDDAIAHYIEALRIKPDYANAHTNLGGVFMTQGRWKEAAAHFQQVVSLGFADAGTYFSLGVVYNQTGQAEQAETQFRKAISAKTDYAEAYNALGVVLGRQGRMGEAIGSFREAVRLKPDFASARKNLQAALSAYPQK